MSRRLATGWPRSSGPIVTVVPGASWSTYFEKSGTPSGSLCWMGAPWVSLLIARYTMPVTGAARAPGANEISTRGPGDEGWAEPFDRFRADPFDKLRAESRMAPKAAAAAFGAIRLSALSLSNGSALNLSNGSAQPSSPGPRVEISFAPGARAAPVTGMVYLAISKDTQGAPIQQSDPEGVPLFSKYVDQLAPGTTVTIGPDDRGHPVASLRDIPAG